MGRINLNIKCSTGSNFSIEVEDDISVEEFKEKLVAQSNIPKTQQRLIYGGHVLKDQQNLTHYSIQNNHTVHLVKGASNSPSSQTSQSSSQNPFSPGGFGSVNPNDFQQMLQQPNMMRDIMNSPIMQSMLDNPEILRSMMTNNPQIREMIERNPEIGHALNNPQILRQTLELARNPELMREMMRNSDRAMSNIESLPEGFNFLRRMYTNVQEPLQNATTSQSTDNPFASLFGGSNQTMPGQSTSTSSTEAPHSTPLPNPWAPQRENAPQSSSSNTGSQSQTSTGFQNPFSTDTNSTLAMLQNPAIQSMLQGMFSNPEFLQQMIQTNPMLQQMVNANPHVAQMLQNPEFLRQMTNPDTLNAVLQMQNAMQQLQGSGMMNIFSPVSPNNSQTNQQQSFPQQNPFDIFNNMFGGGGMASTGQPSQQTQQQTQQNISPQESPEVRFRSQLQQLNDMGFTDQQANIRALLATNGSVPDSVEWLLSHS